LHQAEIIREIKARDYDGTGNFGVEVSKFCPTIIIIAFNSKSSTAANAGINANSSGTKMVSSCSCTGLK
jgi:precorrin-6B methylase 2